MNEKEKIMINSYFEGELDESEKLLAEALLKDDNEARKFYEGLKQLDNYLDTFEKNSFTAEQRKEALDFAESLKSKAENKFPNNFWIPIFQNSWINPSGITMARTGLALSFAFFFSFGFIADRLYLSSIGNNLNLSNFSDASVFTKEISSLRNSTSNDEFETNLKLIIEEMIDSKVKTGRLIYSSKSYIIFLESKFKNEGAANYFCYQGVLEGTAYDEFVFCKGSQNSSILLY